MSRGVVIVGAGQGGLNAAACLRQEKYDGPITLIGAEPGLPYQRPPLSKAYMADGAADRLLLKPEAWFEKSGIDYRAGTEVSAIDRAARTVAAGGQAIGYDHLILAMGARNLRPPFPGLNSAGVYELRTLADAAAIRSRLADTKHAVVIGGGFIGLEFAAMARGAGVGVTLVEAGPRLMGRAVSPAMSDWFLSLHREMGSEIRLDSPAAGIVETQGRARGVALADGGEIAGDLMLLAVGVRPNIELAAAAGLANGDGIMLDGQLLTEDPAISALGDVARFPMRGLGHVRLESVQAAVDHGRHIAKRVVRGATRNYSAVPWFWSDQGAAKLQIAGLGSGADRHIEIATPGAEPIVLGFRDQRLTVVETVNAPGPHMAARKLIGASWDDLAAVDFDLRAAWVALKSG